MVNTIVWKFAWLAKSELLIRRNSGPSQTENTVRLNWLWVLEELWGQGNYSGADALDTTQEALALRHDLCCGLYALRKKRRICLVSMICSKLFIRLVLRVVQGMVTIRCTIRAKLKMASRSCVGKPKIAHFGIEHKPAALTVSSAVSSLLCKYFSRIARVCESGFSFSKVYFLGLLLVESKRSCSHNKTPRGT